MSSSSKPRHGDPVVIVVKNEFGETEGIPTRQFQQYLDELDKESEQSDAIAQSLAGQISMALFKDLQDQIGSGDALTIDTTSFTIDTTQQFTDQTEA